MAPALVAGLTISHIYRNFPRALIHALAANLGAGVPHLFTIQVIKHLELRIKSGHASSITGKLLRSSFEAFLMEYGVGRTGYRRRSSFCNSTS
jgi:hypothetical protein